MEEVIHSVHVLTLHERALSKQTVNSPDVYALVNCKPCEYMITCMTLP